MRIFLVSNLVTLMVNALGHPTINGGFSHSLIIEIDSHVYGEHGPLNVILRLQKKNPYYHLAHHDQHQLYITA
jgi:hypothetical protein